MDIKIDEDKVMDKVADKIADEVSINLKAWLHHSYYDDNWKYEEFKNQIANLVAQKLYKQLINDPEFTKTLILNIPKSITKAVGAYIARNRKNNK